MLRCLQENDKIIEHLKSQAATGDPITVSLLPGPGMRTDKVFTFQASGSSSIKDIQVGLPRDTGTCVTASRAVRVRLEVTLGEEGT